MLRFIRECQRVFKPHQTRAPCQKVAQDGEENVDQQRRCVSGVASIPLTRVLYSRHDRNKQFLFTTTTQKEEEERASRQDKLRYFGLFEGAVAGAGYALFNSVHTYCSGGRRKKERARFCPVHEFQRVAESVKEAKDLLLSLPLTSRLNVLPRQSSLPSETADAIKDKKLQDDDYLEAIEKVDTLTDRLVSLCTDHQAAADHKLAMEAWSYGDYITALRLWESTVDKFATAIAANRLGICYEKGLGVNRNYNMAEKYYVLASKHGCAEAMYNLAMMRMEGKVRQSSESPVKLIEAAADKGLPKAQTFLGSLHFNQCNESLAIKYYKAAADNDDVDAWFYLGVCYETGAGVQANDCTALKYYIKAAEAGHKDAQYNLAVFYEDGLGDLTKDIHSALYWYKKSAETGNRLAQDRLRELERTNKTVKAYSASCLQEHLKALADDSSALLRSWSETAVCSKTIKRNSDSGLETISASSSLSDLPAGTPKFFLPSSEEFDDNSVSDWSEDSRSSLTADAALAGMWETASQKSLRRSKQSSESFIEFS